LRRQRASTASAGSSVSGAAMLPENGVEWLIVQRQWVSSGARQGQQTPGRRLPKPPFQPCRE
jgi:hypothetical protein